MNNEILQHSECAYVISRIKKNGWMNSFIQITSEQVFFCVI